MKKKCICITGEKNNDSYIDISVDSNGLTLDYDAYSCDSSFSKVVQINFCPFCGNDIKSIKSERLIYQSNLEEKRRLILEKEESFKEETKKIILKQQKEYSENLKLTHSPNVYKFDSFEELLEAFSSVEVKEMIYQKYGIKLSIQQFKQRVKCVQQMKLKSVL